MQAIHQVISVSYDYPVCFTHDLFAGQNEALAQVLRRRPAAGGSERVLCIVERAVAEQHPRLHADIERWFADRHDMHLPKLVRHPVLMAGNERSKAGSGTVDEVHALIHECSLDRHSFVVVIGGGALLDAVGFATATAHRGVRLVRVPTTVLSQADSGVGVKNGVNAFGTKNFVGTFAPPFATINDSAFLLSLPQQHWCGGVAEAVKVAVLRDAEFFAYLERHARQLVARDLDVMRYVVWRSAQLHLEHIATCGDPFEQGSSRPLDFGHWSAHKLEQMSRYRLSHGEAVAIGIALDTTYSWRTALLSRADWRRILRLLDALQLPLHAAELQRRDGGYRDPDVLDGLEQFREHLGGQLTITLLAGIGRNVEVGTIDHSLMIDSIELLAHAHSDMPPDEDTYEVHTDDNTDPHATEPARAVGRILHGAAQPPA